MKFSHMLLAGISSVFLLSCVSNKKFKSAQASAQAKYDSLNGVYAKLQGDLKNCNDLNTDNEKKKSALQSEIDALNKQIAFLKENNNQALKQLQDVSVISSTQAESIKKSLENLGAKDAYIQTLQQAIAHKDSLNMALVMISCCSRVAVMK